MSVDDANENPRRSSQDGGDFFWSGLVQPNCLSFCAVRAHSGRLALWRPPSSRQKPTCQVQVKQDGEHVGRGQANGTSGDAGLQAERAQQ